MKVLFPVLILVSLLFAGGGSYAQSDNIMSGATEVRHLREGVTLKYLYNQDLEGPYATTWYGRLEKSDGDWRDVYVETSEKGHEQAILSFRCHDNRSDKLGVVGYVSFNFGKFPNRSESTITLIKNAEINRWAAGELAKMKNGYNAPYEVYLISEYLFC